MHVYYKFGLFLIFLLSMSTCYTRAAPATNQSTTFDDYTDDYIDDYYDDTDDKNNITTTTTTTTTSAITATATNSANRLKPVTISETEEEQQPIFVPSTSTTLSTLNSLFNIVIPQQRSNHVIEPTCPKACLCLEDYKYVQCSNARLTHVPEDLPNTALIIDLSQNRIKELNPNDFYNCTRVREINLNGNQLAKVDREVFQNLQHLKRLRLSNNYLTHIEPNTFNGAINLDALDLSNNTIILKNKGPFLIQPGLLELSCRNCTWTELYDDTFANFSDLTTLKLDHNNFNRKINTKAFVPLKNLIKLKLPELDENSIQELCNLLKAIDNISFKHFDISCYELVLGASFNESLILATDPPFKPPLIELKQNSTTAAPNNINNKQQQQQKTNNRRKPNMNITDDNNSTLLTANILNTGDNNKNAADDDDKTYQVPVSQEAINILLISIMIIAVIGLVIGVICRKDIGGIKTKCCRSRKPEPKDQVHPAEEIPLNKLG